MLQLALIVTPSQTLNRFTVLDALRLAYIADRETANIQIGTINDQFTRNLVTILCEEAKLLVVENGNAAVYGQNSQTG